MPSGWSVRLEVECALASPLVRPRVRACVRACVRESVSVPSVLDRVLDVQYFVLAVPERRDCPHETCLSPAAAVLSQHLRCFVFAP